MSVVSFLYESDVFLLWRRCEPQVGRVVLALIVRIAILWSKAIDLVLHLFKDVALLSNLALRFNNLVRETINETICGEVLRV